MRTSSSLPPCLLISPKPFHSRGLWSHFRPCKLKTLNIKHWLSGCYSWAKISPKFSSEKKQQCERWTVEVQWRRTGHQHPWRIYWRCRKRTEKRKFKDRRRRIEPRRTAPSDWDTGQWTSLTLTPMTGGRRETWYPHNFNFTPHSTVVTSFILLSSFNLLVYYHM